MVYGQQNRSFFSGIFLLIPKELFDANSPFLRKILRFSRDVFIDSKGVKWRKSSEMSKIFLFN